MQFGRGRNAHGVHLAKELAVIRQRLRARRRGDFRSTIRNGIDNRGQGRAFKAREDARVMPPEMPHTDHCRAHCVSHSARSSDVRQS